MPRNTPRILSLVLAVSAFGACKFAPSVPNGHIICKTVSDCPSGYTCEAKAEKNYNVCCKDKGCGAIRDSLDGAAGDTSMQGGPGDLVNNIDGSRGTSLDGNPVDGTLADGPAGSPVDRFTDGLADGPATGLPDGPATGLPDGPATGLPDGPADGNPATTRSDTQGNPLGPDALDSVVTDGSPTGGEPLPDSTHPSPEAPPAPDVYVYIPGPDGPNRADSADRPVGPEAGRDLWGPEAQAIPDAPPDLPTGDAPGSCGIDDDCPVATPMCLSGMCKKCGVTSDCAGNASGPMCNTTSGRCVTCLGDSDCTDPSKPLCGNGKCTACTYAANPNGCCVPGDCDSGGVGSTVTCNSEHTCVYGCDATHTSCNGACIAIGDCCENADCNNGGPGTTGTCESTHKCTYACDSAHHSCNGECILKSACCIDNDCDPVTLPNECQYQGCLVDQSCGPKPRANTTACASGAGTCDGAGSCLVCAANQYRCNGTVLQQCNSTRTGFNTVADCGSTALCPAAGPSCYVCEPNKTFCDPTDPHTARLCSSDGHSSTPNRDPNKWCVNGQLVQCRDVNDCPLATETCTVATCSGNSCGFTGSGSGTACGDNGTCDGGGRCIGPVGRSCSGSPAVNCTGVSASGSSQTVSCCESILIGGTYPMGRGSGDQCPGTMSCPNFDTPEHQAIITPFYLDAFEVTVGRFRKFYSWYGGPTVDPTHSANPNIAGSGWNSSWNSYLPSNSVNLLSNIITCPGSSWPQASDPPTPDPEQRPVNCVTWYEAFAFCVYDGGRLPTEAEWELAAAGGDANRFYPWGGYSASTLPANYDGNVGSYKNIVGAFPTGVGRFGHLDLIGNVAEWVLDGISTTWYNNFPTGTPCRDCADLNASDIAYRGVRGGAWDYVDLATLRSTDRQSAAPNTRSAENGFRCAHDRP
jgi:formylglycine-generating enzyme